MTGQTTGADTPTAPLLDGSIAGKIAVIENAIVVPPAKGLGNQAIQKSGVLRPDGSIVEESITWRGRSRVTIAPEMPAEDELDHLEGSHVFMGPLFGHFGHFLVESIARIWALDHIDEEIDGICFVPKFQNRPQHVMQTYRPFMNALGVNTAMVNLANPTRVDKLYVPQQGFGMFHMIEGAPEYREFIRKHAGHSIAPQGAEKIYISRSALPPIRGSVIGEQVIEERLKAEGYEIYHPQKHSFQDQIAAYRAAKQIVAIDCSPLHLLALVGNADQKVAVIARRDGDLETLFANQIKAFQNADARGFNHLRRNWIEETHAKPSRTSWGEISLRDLSVSLKRMGLIEGGMWPELTDDEVAADVAKLAEGVGAAFKPFEG